LAQWGPHEAALLSPMMRATPSVGGGLLLGAGLFQWAPLKRQCLVHCRSPLGFLIGHWRDGSTGALAMGARHGVYCVGCCWMLMALLFVVGVMNLLWVTAIAAFVFVERLAPRGDIVGRLAGVVLVMAGLVLMLR
jgi:predicted metal-binding membrane protein